LQAKQARDHAGPMKAGEWNGAMRDHDASTISQKKNKATAVNFGAVLLSIAKLGNVSEKIS
jgi:hypothetical protein